jgi:1-deoxy-D-xylulose-5-phosphate synthase
MTALPIGKAVTKREGSNVAILNFGTLLGSAIQAAEKLDATVVDMRFVKPLDKEMVLKLAASHKLLVTLEENAIAGGAGSGVSELLAEEAVVIPVLQLGLGDKLIDHANHNEQLSLAGLDSEQIIDRIQQRLDRL